MKKGIRQHKELYRQVLIFITLPVSFLFALILFSLEVRYFFVYWLLIWGYTFTLFWLGWSAYIKQMQANQEELKQLVTHESLINRSLLLINTEEKLKNVLSLEIERCADSNIQSALVFFDVDELGEINRKYGFDVGDGIIVDLIKATQSLISPQDHLGRVKGDTFAVVFPNKDKEQAYAFAYELSEKVKQLEKKLEVPVTCRFVTLTIDGWNTDDRVITLAYEQLKIAKQLGRGVIL